MSPLKNIRKVGVGVNKKPLRSGSFGQNKNPKLHPLFDFRILLNITINYP